MLARFLRMTVAASIVVWVAGCGGGSGGGGTGGGGNQPTTVTISFRGATPTLVAAKIGSGAFTGQTVSSGKLSLSIPSGTSNFSVAYLCPGFSAGPTNPTITQQIVIEASTKDGTSFSPTPCPYLASANTPGTLTGSIDASAIAGVSTVLVDASSGNNLVEIGVPVTGNFSISAPTGTDRVEVVAYENSPTGNYGALSLVAARDFSSQTVPGELNSGNPVVLGAGDGVTQQPITYNGVPSGFSAPATLVLADIGAAGEFFVATSATSQYPALPKSAVESGDFYDFIATSRSSTSNGQGVAAEVTASGGNPVTITFPTPWAYAGPTAAALPTFNFDYPGFSGKTGVIQTGIIEWQTGTAQSYYEVWATANYQNGSTTVAFPDLSGFLPAAASQTTLIWSAEVSQNSAGAFQPLTANTTISVVENVGGYTVP